MTDAPGMVLGGWALLRSAGLPMRLWLEAANPDLAFQCRYLTEAEARYADVAQVLAAEIGEVLVSHPDVDATLRRAALRCRRRLHAGEPVDAVCMADLSAGARAIAHPDLAERLTTVSRLGTLLARRRAELEAAVADENSRLLGASWTALTASPMGSRGLAEESISHGDDIADRVRRGESWATKRMRQRSDYLWRMIARGAAKTTPRGWLGHVSLVQLQRSYAGPDGLILTAQTATRWTENVHTAQSSLLHSTASAPAEGVRVALSPLSWVTGDHVHVWTVNREGPRSLQRIQLRLTPLLAAIRTALRDGSKPIEAVVAATAPDDDRGRSAIHGFILRLAELGVCQLSTTPGLHRSGWTGNVAPARKHDGQQGYLDVYRRSDDRLPWSTYGPVESALPTVSRLNALITADEHGTNRNGAEIAGIGAQPVGVLEILTRLDAGRIVESNRSAAHAGHHLPLWPTPRQADSGYARLVELLARTPTEPRIFPAGHTFDITEAVLDQLGAAQPSYEWPVDCVVRPVRDGQVVLDTVADAGMLDARFLAELARLHGGLAHVSAYREFLRRLDEHTGVRSVEILVPSWSERAANAIQRPLYTSAWTGDPDLATYVAEQVVGATYIPLEALTVRLRDGRRVVEADGSPVRIVYHSARLPPPPWNLLIELLHSGPSVPRFRRLRHSLAVTPQRTYLPRITVGGSVILTVAQWRVDSGSWWDPAASNLDKVRHLARLRDRLGLPRWVMVCPGLGGRPVPCDLDSLHALAVFETAYRLADNGSELVIEEMVPSPDELTIRDQAAGRPEPVAAEVLLRFPQDVDVATLARRTAHAAAGHPVSWIPRQPSSRLHPPRQAPAVPARGSTTPGAKFVGRAVVS